MPSQRQPKQLQSESQLIFELSREGRTGYQVASTPEHIPPVDLPAKLVRKSAPRLPEVTRKHRCPSLYKFIRPQSPYRPGFLPAWFLYYEVQSEGERRVVRSSRFCLY